MLGLAAATMCSAVTMCSFTYVAIKNKPQQLYFQTLLRYLAPLVALTLRKNHMTPTYTY